MTSFTVDTPMHRIPSGTFSLERHDWGRMQVVKPSFAASLTRYSAMETDRTSPDRPTSPNRRVCSSTGISRKEEIRAVTTARSIAGSFIRMPPATFT